MKDVNFMINSIDAEKNDKIKHPIMIKIPKKLSAEKMYSTK